MRLLHSFAVVCALALLFVGAFGLRLSSESALVGRHGIQLSDPGDPYYHLRRIVDAARRFPAYLEHDRYVNHPDGAEIVWPPAHDWAIAAVARAWVGTEEARVERVAVRAPAVIGAWTVLAVAWVARRRFGPAAGWWAGAGLALLPAHVLQSQAGQLGHPVATGLATAWLFGSGVAWAAQREGPSRWASVGLGLASAVAVLLWPGAWIPVGVLLGLLVLHALLTDDAREVRGRAAGLAIANGLAALAVAPAAAGRDWAEFGAWSPWVLSNFHPAAFLAVAIVLLGVAASATRPVVGTTRTRRAVVAGLAAAAVVAATVALVPTALEGGTPALGTASHAEPHGHGLAPFDPALAAARFTPLVFAFPLLWLALAVRCVRRRPSADRFVLLGAAAVFGALAGWQPRFGDAFAIFFVWIVGWAAVELSPIARLAWRRHGGLWRAGVAAGLVTSLLLVLESLAHFQAGRYRDWARAQRDPIGAHRSALPARYRLHDAAARWLREASPETAGWDDPSVTPEYGVLCAGDAGHLVRYRARRPMVHDGFGPTGGRGHDAALRYFAARDEERAVELLIDLGARYVMADRLGPGGGEPSEAGSMTERLAEAFGSARPASLGVPELPALRHHRLVWHRRTGREPALPAEAPGFALGVWERVPGARVVGYAAPGERVEARLALTTRQGRPHLYRSFATADGVGRYELVLPYPTDVPWSDAVRSDGDWRIEGARRGGRLVVPEAAVQAGSELIGPDLREPDAEAEAGIG